MEVQMDQGSEDDLRRRLKEFLKDFKGLVTENKYYVKRHPKNNEALTILNLNYFQRESILLSLKVDDFYDGPKPDTINSGEYFEFGKVVNGITVYIKIKIDTEHDKAYCYSFHPAEFTVRYPLRKI
jgi:hypothetical protein